MLDTSIRSRTTTTHHSPVATSDAGPAKSQEANPSAATNPTTDTTTTTPEAPASRATPQTAQDGRTLAAANPLATQLRQRAEARADEPGTATGGTGKDPALSGGGTGKDPALDDDDVGGGYTRVEGDAFRTDAEGNEVPPEIGDVDQGDLGDCWLMAASAAVAHTDPEYIQDRISENEDGSFDVRLGDETQRVQPTFPDAGYADPTPNGQSDTLWPALVEKAYAQQEGNSYENLDGGNPGRALESLTGQPSTRTAITPTGDVDDTWTALRGGIDGDHPMVASTHDTGTAEPLHDNHAYAVLDAYERDGQRYVQVYNPWGVNDGARGVGDVTHEMTLEDFQANFGDLYVSGG
ncbi:MAG: hypothetical protein KC933_25920 [Myxococcales bacterium]|nr:hypothetical protein [Myxococcales bacterium]MCB9645228.1 hypothetical protein [Deltaproteobacteria bacterium]